MTKNHWNQTFSKDEYIYGKEPNDFIKQMSDMIPAQSKVVCLAEGEGRNAVFLAGLGHDVTTYDQSEVGLNKTRELAMQNNVEVRTVEMDLTKDRVPSEKFDAGILVFGHVLKEDQAFLFKNLIGSVKPGGYVMFEVYSEKQIDYKTGGPGSVDALYDPAILLNIIEEHEVLHFFYGEVERYEGINHTGRCHVVQSLIRKK